METPVPLAVPLFVTVFPVAVQTKYQEVAQTFENILKCDVDLEDFETGNDYDRSQDVRQLEELVYKFGTLRSELEGMLCDHVHTHSSEVADIAEWLRMSAMSCKLKMASVTENNSTCDVCSVL